MYELLKLLLSAAEQIGKLRSVRMDENDEYAGNRIVLEGDGIHGGAFLLELTVQKVNTDV